MVRASLRLVPLAVVAVALMAAFVGADRGGGREGVTAPPADPAVGPIAAGGSGSEARERQHPDGTVSVELSVDELDEIFVSIQQDGSLGLSCARGRDLARDAMGAGGSVRPLAEVK